MPAKKGDMEKSSESQRNSGERGGQGRQGKREGPAGALNRSCTMMIAEEVLRSGEVPALLTPGGTTGRRQAELAQSLPCSPAHDCFGAPSHGTNEKMPPHSPTGVERVCLHRPEWCSSSLFFLFLCCDSVLFHKKGRST